MVLTAATKRQHCDMVPLTSREHQAHIHQASDTSCRLRALEVEWLAHHLVQPFDSGMGTPLVLIWCWPTFT